MGQRGPGGNGRMNGWTDGWTDGQTDGRTNESPTVLQPEYDEFDEINEKFTLNYILSQLWQFLTCFWSDTAMRVKFSC